MDDRARRALRRGHLVDITTTGRRSGQEHRVELVFHNLDGRIFISGRPGRRGWYANLVAHPDFTFHLKGPIAADLPARARPVTDRAERERVLAPIAAGWRYDLGVMVADAPLVEVLFDEAA
ncbi:MAG: nitroreductase/quinone reductase family protein [Candidatus Limnocylindria bacterium]